MVLRLQTHRRREHGASISNSLLTDAKPYMSHFWKDNLTVANPVCDISGFLTTFPLLVLCLGGLAYFQYLALTNWVLRRISIVKRFA